MTITKEFLLQYLRIGLYALFSVLAYVGFSVGDSAKETIVGVAGFVVTLIWTTWGSTLTARLNEVAKAAGVSQIVVTDPATAQAVASDKVVAG